MDQQIQNRKLGHPDYKKIYLDMILKRYPQKKAKCENILSKDYITVLDVIMLENIIFGHAGKEDASFNQKHKSYDKDAVYKILEYQRTNMLNNTQLSNHFKISRNTIAKWRKIYTVWNFSTN